MAVRHCHPLNATRSLTVILQLLQSYSRHPQTVSFDRISAQQLPRPLAGRIAFHSAPVANIFRSVQPKLRIREILNKKMNFIGSSNRLKKSTQRKHFVHLLIDFRIGFSGAGSIEQAEAFHRMAPNRFFRHSPPRIYPVHFNGFHSVLFG